MFEYHIRFETWKKNQYGLTLWADSKDDADNRFRKLKTRCKILSILKG